MPRTNLPRRFNLGDLLIVVVALAIFFGLARQSWHRATRGYAATSDFNLDLLASIETLPVIQFAIVEIIGTGLVLANFTLTIMGVRQPRRRWRHLMRQPGWVAGGAALVAASAAIVNAAVERGHEVQMGMSNWDHSTEPMLMLGPLAFGYTICPVTTPLLASLAIVVAWGLLAASGRWRAEHSWIDRLGRILALGWLGLLAGRVYLDLRP